MYPLQIERFSAELGEMRIKERIGIRIPLPYMMSREKEKLYAPRERREGGQL